MVSRKGSGGKCSVRSSECVARLDSLMRASAKGSQVGAAPDEPPAKQCVAPAARGAAAASHVAGSQQATAAPHARGGSARRAKAAGGSGGGWRTWVLPVLALVLWFVSSSAIIVVNKRLLVDEGFAYPLTLTGLSQFVSAFGGACCCRSLISCCAPPPPAPTPTPLAHDAGLDAVMKQ